MPEIELDAKYWSAEEVSEVQMAKESLEIIRSYYALTRGVAYEDYTWDTESPSQYPDFDYYPDYENKED